VTALATPAAHGGWVATAARLGPGLLAAAAVAITARLLTTLLPAGTAEVAVAILLGLVVGAIVPRTWALSPGLRIATTRLLRIGIVLLGARLSLDAVLAVGVPIVLVVAVLVPVGVGLGIVLGRLAGLPPHLALLLGVGTAICGNSAILATAPVIGADERDVSVAVATITAFGLLAVLLYPLIGQAFGLDDATYGRWAGLAVHDTSQVVAAGLVRSEEAADTAVVVKLVRNTALAPVLVAVAWAWQRSARRSDPAAAAGAQGLRAAVPLFVLGFLAMVVLASLGLFDPVVGGRSVADWLTQVGLALILVAVAAIGLGTRPSTLLRSGPRALLVGLLCAAIVAALAFVIVVGGPAAVGITGR
jgi:uncharacterized integral membrane protein (TIGR00698 family)